MKQKISAKLMLIIVSAVLVLAVAVGATVAFLVDQTPSIDNTFVPVSVSCRVQEVFDTAANTKTNVTVQNTGDIPAYIRAVVVVTWVAEEGGTTYGGAPKAGVDYVAEFSDNGWAKGTDGFYYCTSPVSPNQSTPVLLNTASPVEGKAPEGYVLSVQIIASAIQAEPAEAITSAWKNVTVNTDGSITPQ